MPSIWPRQQLHILALHLSSAAFIAASWLAFGRIIPTRLVAPPDVVGAVVVVAVVSCAGSVPAKATSKSAQTRFLGMIRLRVEVHS